MAIDNTPIDPNAPIQKKPISFINLALGAGLNLFEVSTLGQPFEVIKTQMAANRGQKMPQAVGNIWSRGGVLGFYQGLIPWAWIEAATKGAVLFFAASELEYRCRLLGASTPVAGILGGMGGGIAQVSFLVVVVVVNACPLFVFLGEGMSLRRGGRFDKFDG
jgi:hypothetical protein